MKITISKQELSSALSLSTATMAKKDDLSLSNILIQAVNDELVITSSNGNVSTRIHVSDQLNIEQEGSMLIDGKTISDAISKLNGTISIEKMKNKVKINNELAEYKLHSVDVSSYPNIDFVVSDNEFVVDGNMFNQAISKVINSTSTQDDRPIFTGVHFKSVGNTIELVATDSYRLSKSYIDINEAVEVDVAVLADTLKTIMKVAKDQELYISTNNNKVTFRTNKAIFVTRVIDGVFPDTNRLIPTEFKTHVTVNREQLIKAVDRSSFMKEDNIWILNLDLKDDILKLVTKAQEIGSTFEEVPISLQGNNINLSLSGKYLLDALNSLVDDEVVFNLVGDLQALTVTDTSNQIQLLLPVRTNY